MKTLLCAAVFAGATAWPAFAGQQHDPSIEKAAAEIVAARIGGLRGGFSYRQKPQFVIAQDPPAPTRAASENAGERDLAEPKGGLAPAIDRSVSRIIY